MFQYIIFVSCISLVFGQEMFLGACPNVSPVQNFNITAFAGRWYELQKYAGLFQDVLTSCNAQIYELQSDNVTFNMFFSSMEFLRGIRIIKATATLTNPANDEGALTISIPAGTSVDSTTPNYYILGTDYSNYAIVHTCRNYYFFSLQNLWLLTRNRDPAFDVISLARLQTMAQGVNIVRLRTINQFLCPASI